MDKFSYVANADPAALEELYQHYLTEPQSVDNSWQRFFEGYEFSLARWGEKNGVSKGDFSNDEVRVYQFIDAYREYGHLQSSTNPVRKRLDRKAGLSLTDFGFSEQDLDREFHAGEELGLGKASLRDIVNTLRRIYEHTIGWDYYEVRNRERFRWIREAVEKQYPKWKPSFEDEKHLLKKLNEAVVFENFLHTKYVGQKRFSLEGGESTIPALDTLINALADLGAEEVNIGMAHRGRLNVLANIMQKTYEQIFNEFEGQVVIDSTMGDGDVKYHLGFSSEITTRSGKNVFVNLVPNPSHLEAVNPVVEGISRAKSDFVYDNDHSKVVPILIHGDAAIAAQGIVYEVAQMSELEGYHTGGTIHFVINNQLGFTTDFIDARSSTYSTDVADIIDSPVFHVNGDDPEAVMFVCKIAAEFRQKFQRDVFIDMVCYRRHGHNESDEPKFTQPKLYNIISKHPNPREVYTQKLIEKGNVEAEIAKQMDEEFRGLLQDRLNMVKQKPLPYQPQPLQKQWAKLRWSKPEDFNNSPETAISKELIDKIGKALINVPQGFKPLRQVERLIKERKKMFDDGNYNWATAELMAFGACLVDNNFVRVSGQDSIRGTFSHRHAVLFDAETNEPYSSLDYIQEGQEQLRIYNSLLSEYGVLGFEFGYSLANPNSLTIWEAQFGDFANGAQVMIDQFITCAESKWQRMSGLVMLLPHGYEGQGPEHSSARLERFLQMSAEYNVIVANITSPANYFHALRRQLAWDFRKPLVVMSPKSLLRNPVAMSPEKEFIEGKFREVIDDPVAKATKTKRLLLCTGKIYYDLLEEKEKQNRDDVAIVRIEQLYPFPKEQVDSIIKKYKTREIFWVQEEPENMGAWSFLLRFYRKEPLEVISRKISASPATGFAKTHAEEQKRIIEKSFAPLNDK